MSESSYDGTIRDPKFGFRRLDPLPEPDELAEFYESRYYDLVRRGGRGPDLARLIAGGEAAEAERAWLAATLWRDLADGILADAPGRRVLDVGCGTGDLVAWLAAEGLDAHGLEPSADAAEHARSLGLDVETTDLRGYVAARPDARFDAVILVNVLEHTPDAPQLVPVLRKLLNPGGLVFIQVPNDFNALQLAARESADLEPWWITRPDHVHYFDFDSLEALFGAHGFETLDRQADFPMELFLLLGWNYVGDPSVGGDCHRRRVAFEQALPVDVRRRLSSAFANAGFGRNCRVFFRRVEAR